MPDAEGKMDDADLGTIQNWVRDHAVKNCPICGGADFGVFPYVVQTPVYAGTGGRVGLGPRTYAHVLLQCRVCAWEAFFNAAELGVIEYGGNGNG